MSKPLVFEINEVYRQEAVRLLSSRKKSKLIHSSGDIDASGDEIEVPFRDFLRRRLPNQYFVGHGHIVDRFLNVSPQFDVIIADNNATPILFEAENGSQYFPWESVYAIGEVKSTHIKGKHPIGAFAKSIEDLKKRLNRLPTPPNYLGQGLSLGEGLSSSESRPFKNPLFQFIVFFDSGDAEQSDLADEYCSNTDENLPVISLFLDGKIIVKAELTKVAGKVGMGAIDVDPMNILVQRDIDWMRVHFTDPHNGGSQALVTLMLGLFDHLNRCVLMAPPISDYLNTVLHSAPNQPEPLSLGAMLKLSAIEIPEEAVGFLKHRAAHGKSPFRQATQKEIDEFQRETGKAANSFLPQSGLEPEGSSSEKLN